MTVKVILVDENPFVRFHLRSALKTVPWFEIVGEATPGSAALGLVGLVQPHLVLLDVHTSPTTGLGMVKLIRARFPRVRIVAVGDSSDPVVHGEAIRAGATAYVPTSWRAEAAAHAIEGAMTGPRPTLLDLTETAPQRASPG